MDCQGQVVVANYLANLCKKGIKGNNDVEMEMEILKFFKKSLSNKVSYDHLFAQDEMLTVRMALSTLCRNLKSSMVFVIRSLRQTSLRGKQQPKS